MKLSDFDYNLPENLIAKEPVRPRDSSRLLVLNKKSGKLAHRHFYDLVDYLDKGDLLVMNNSKVIPARLIGKKETGGKQEVFLLKKIKGAVWECLLGGKKKYVGLRIFFSKNLNGVVAEENGDGTWWVKFNLTGKKFDEELKKVGHVPLPPYIKKKDSAKDKISYQTVYADDKKQGSVAAPTAGLHFTPALLAKLKKKGVQIEFITLHVGLGTFQPVKVENIKKHKMHAEYVEIKKSVFKKIREAKNNGGRVITVGTTSARALESFNSEAQLSSRGWTDIFIYPGYKFKAVDGMITNFHLPKSTLLMLVSALAGAKNIKKAYAEATKRKYRFYSYGDAMLIL